MKICHMRVLISVKVPTSYKSWFCVLNCACQSFYVEKLKLPPILISLSATFGSGEVNLRSAVYQEKPFSVRVKSLYKNLLWSGVFE